MINIQNTDDNKCFKWCLVRYLNPADHDPRRITKADTDFSLVFLATKIKKNIQSMYQKNVVKKKHVDLLLI